MTSVEKRIKRLAFIERSAGRIVIVAVALTMAFLMTSLYDVYKFTRAGLGTVEYHDFRSLKAMNPDTVAWLTMDGTHIDHPVVQGADNFAYLDKGFDGRYYAGGSVFLDAGNDPLLEDRYLIIHGHHMSGGAMFGDLGKYLDEGFLEEFGTGEIRTEKSVYQLTVAGAGSFDAYDSIVYATGDEAPMGKLAECSVRRDLDWNESDKLLALSTCSGEMNDNRIVVFCRMRYTGVNDD